MTIEELKKYKWFVATCKYEGIIGKKHCFTYDVDNLNTNLLSGMILVDDELVKETEEKGVWQDCVFDAICDEKSSNRTAMFKANHSLRRSSRI